MDDRTTITLSTHIDKKYSIMYNTHILEFAINLRGNQTIEITRFLRVIFLLLIFQISSVYLWKIL